jgi:hypothetical protein
MIANALHQTIGSMEVARRLADTVVGVRTAHFGNHMQGIVDMRRRLF